MHSKNIYQESFWITISLSAILYYLFPFVSVGTENIFLSVHDNLEADMAWKIILAQSNKIFAFPTDKIELIFNGVPRGIFGSEFNLLMWLYVFFDPFIAYAINEFLVHIIAFFGMVLLLKNYFISTKNNSRNLIIYSTATLFAMLPFWSVASLGIAGQPLALYAFLNFRNKSSHYYDWLILFIVPFYSDFVRSFFFFLCFIFIIYFYDLFF